MAISKGKTFTDNEQVTAGKLHQLVDDATIDAAAVDTAQIADDAVTNAKVATAAGIALSKITASSGKLVGGSATSVAEEVTLASSLDLTSSTLSLADDAVTTAKILDGAVSAAKLASTLDLSSKTVTLADASVEYSKLNQSFIDDVPDATPASGDYLMLGTGSGNRRAQVSDVIGVGKGSATAAIDGVTGQALSGSHGLGSTPTWLRCVLVCDTTDANYDAGDEIDIDGVFVYTTLGGDAGEPWATYGAGTGSYFVSVGNNGELTSWQCRAQDKTLGTSSELTLANWHIKLYYGL